MTYLGYCENGVIKLDGGVTIADGSMVRVEVLSPRDVPAEGAAETVGPSLLDRMKDFVGSAQNLPADAASNVDHYLYGLPKK